MSEDGAWDLLLGTSSKRKGDCTRRRPVSACFFFTEISWVSALRVMFHAFTEAGSNRAEKAIRSMLKVDPIKTTRTLPSGVGIKSVIFP